MWKLNVDKCFESKLRFTCRNVSKTLPLNWYISGSTKPIKTVETVHRTLTLWRRNFLLRFPLANFSCFCLLHELPTNKSTSLASRHTLKPADISVISGSTKRIKTVERDSFYKTEFSVDFHDVPSISRFSLVFANFSCFCFRYDYRQTKRPPHSLSRSRSGTLSNQLMSRVLKSKWRQLKQ